MNSKQIVNKLLEDYDPDLAEVSPEEVASKTYTAEMKFAEEVLEKPDEYSFISCEAAAFILGGLTEAFKIAQPIPVGDFDWCWLDHCEIRSGSDSSFTDYKGDGALPGYFHVSTKVISQEAKAFGVGYVYAEQYQGLGKARYYTATKVLCGGVTYVPSKVPGFFVIKNP